VWEWPTVVNLACGRHPEYLYDPLHYAYSLVELKDGVAGAVVFAAIVGVPPGTSSPCEGWGDELDECLDHPDMQPVETVIDGMYWFYEPACILEEGDVVVTNAIPGRRYVELAQYLDSRAYVYSICNPDWNRGMTDIATLIASQLPED
jgi:hypothetical protein